MSKPKNSIAKRLNAAQLAINNSLADAQIQNLVGAYGYSVEKLNAGKTLYTAAVDAVNRAQAAFGAQQQATAHVKSARKIARDAYQSLAHVARAVMKDNPGQLVTLGLDKPMSNTTAGFLSQALTCFDNALGVSEIQVVLKEYGYTEERLQNERTKITNYDQANQVQEAAKGAAQQAAVLQNAALHELDNWIACYLKIAKVALRQDKQLLEKIGIVVRTSKTVAQRTASAKAQASD